MRMWLTMSWLLIQVVHVYRVIEHGRRFFRSLIFSSESSLTLHSFEHKARTATTHHRTAQPPGHGFGRAMV